MKRRAAIGAGALAACGALFLFASLIADHKSAILEVVKDAALPIPALKAAGGDAYIFAAGDMMFDRQIRNISDVQGGDYLFGCIDPLIQSAGFAIANLEGPITENSSLSLGSVVGSTANYYFTFPTTTAALLARQHIGAVDLGNNHILNFGYAGLSSTQAFLTAAGVGYFGGVSGDENIFRTVVSDIPISIIGYNEFGGSSTTTVAGEVAAEHKAGRVVIVYSHWGDEYVDSSPRLRPVATLFADAGANAVIGMHPHVVLGHEYIGDTLVYYSLGNFIFDQYWTDSVDHGLALMLDITPAGKVTAVEHPVVLNPDGQTCEAVQ